MQEIKLTTRLAWFCDRVRRNVQFVDVGTDHAKLPVALVKNGRVKQAIAADIGEGPIARARMYIHAAGCGGKIETAITDGLAGLPIHAPCDIAICGMGGETILGILDAAPIVRQTDVRLLLQPMTAFALLRRYLADNGFAPEEEDIVASEGRMYQCMVVSYSGTPYTLTETEAELGKLCIAKRSETFLQYVQRRYTIVEKCLLGKQKANADTSAEEALLAGYEKILKD